MPGEGLDFDGFLDDDDEILLGGYQRPKDNCCWLYQNRVYGDSNPFQVCHNGQNEVINLSGMFDDQAESYNCGKNMFITFCDDQWGHCHHKASSAGRVSNPDIGANFANRLTSVEVRPYDVVNHGAANLFADWDCSGHSAAFMHNSGESKSKYNAADLDAWGVGRDKVSTVALPRGYAVELWEHDGQGGNVEVIYGR